MSKIAEKGTRGNATVRDAVDELAALENELVVAGIAADAGDEGNGPALAEVLGRIGARLASVRRYLSDASTPVHIRKGAP